MLLGGGPGLYGYDGWITYGVAQDSGVLHQDSIEIDEQKYPIMFDSAELTPDSSGDGQWRGAPALKIVMGPRNKPMTIVYFNDQHYFPARGVLKGTSAKPSEVAKYNVETEEFIEIPQISEQVFEPKERIVIRSATGGGYGDPLERDPELVKWDVREEFVSNQRAREVYGVVLNTESEHYTVDYKKTQKLRTEMRRERGNDK
jgi:N-methylhydantoinase B